MPEFTIGHLFAGIGGGALGAARARVAIQGTEGAFRTLGGVDFDPASCRDFEALAGAPAVERDVAAMQPAELRAAWGNDPPDMVLLSPPCKGFSALLSKQRATDPRYVRMNRLILDGLFLLCSTWDPPSNDIWVDGESTGGRRSSWPVPHTRHLHPP